MLTHKQIFSPPLEQMSTYCTVIKCLGDNGEWEKAFGVIGTMESKGVAPTHEVAPCEPRSQHSESDAMMSRFPLSAHARTVQLV